MTIGSGNARLALSNSDRRMIITFDCGHRYVFSEVPEAHESRCRILLSGKLRYFETNRDLGR
jgi:hypothetical protein